MTRTEQIERSLIKRFRTDIWKKFIRAINEYKMIEENDCIAVCISGGKDSMLLAKCMQEIQRHGKMQFTLKCIVMDPGYSKENMAQIRKNLEILGIDAHIFTSNIFDVVHQAGGSPCYLCARMRRGCLYNYAQSLGCNKIALGHHFDDVIETVLLSMFYGSEIKTMMPKVVSEHFENMELIRPLYMVPEKDIMQWCVYNDLHFLHCACKFTEEIETKDKEENSKRKLVKKFIDMLRSRNERIDENIFTSLHNVNIDALPGYRKNGTKHSFLENYTKNKGE